MSAGLGGLMLAALAPGETRIATAVLLERLRPAFPGLSGVGLGKALTATGWTAEQWRTPQGRVRGYAPPASGSFAVAANQRQCSGKAAPARMAPAAPEFSPPAGLGGREGTRMAPAPVTGCPAGKPAPSAVPAPRPASGSVGPGPHAGPMPPVLPCRCGSRRWWRSRLRSPGWLCLGCTHPASGDPVVVIAMQPTAGAA